MEVVLDAKGWTLDDFRARIPGLKARPEKAAALGDNKSTRSSITWAPHGSIQEAVSP